MKGDIIREIYLKAEPSVDLKTVTEQVDCCAHTIKMSVYDELLAEHCESADERMAVNMFMLQSGPQLVEG